MMELSKIKSHLGPLSYILIMAVLGVPIWWRTTEVYRALLPYDAIDALSDIEYVTQKVNIILITPDAQGVHSRGPEVQKLLNSQLYDLSLNVRAPSERESKVLESAVSLGDVDEEIGKGLAGSVPGAVVLLEAPRVLLVSPSSLVAGNYRTIYFTSATPSQQIAAMLMDTVLGEQQMSRLWETPSSPASSPTSASLLRKKSTGKIDVQLSLLVPEPEYVVASWDIKGAVHKYLDPFLSRFPLHVPVNSQVIYLTSLNIPGGEEGQGPLEVKAEDLALALNSVESLLSSQSSSSPALNLIIYIPPVHRTPLTVRGSKNNSFLIPSWGGVYIYNYNLPGDKMIKYPTSLELDMELVSKIWVGQLRSLLGVQVVDERKSLALNPRGLRDWELDYQLRYRAGENIVEVRRTLESLSRLLHQIPNIVITEDIARRVEMSLNKLRMSVSYLKEGRITEAHSASQSSLQQAEAAFFDPSLLSLLYFPDDQKYAIYVPYFLPVGLPILLSIKSIIKAIKTKPKEE
ncbi:GPI transamidase component PIG-S [Eurytemora carolleeae]|uniref:GPI transamidase component PIG-S n=1 Tax=Eurytemora carolleeae TaxID=1294199 RepID=UPI000C774C84|nr:GPI transamidase component PIG-S [Eurytemora carolleeae]|eukprot:XP_023341084.1 GPI transamidase component PIG-S-like [Eurytemora affinis]